MGKGTWIPVSNSARKSVPEKLRIGYIWMILNLSNILGLLSSVLGPYYTGGLMLILEYVKLKASDYFKGIFNLYMQTKFFIICQTESLVFLGSFSLLSIKHSQK